MRAEGARRRRARGGRGRRGKLRAVSEVVATILLLALTVALFSGLFFIVQRLPGPAPAQSNEFSVTPVYSGGSSSTLAVVRILHLAGPTLSGGTTNLFAIYLHSQAHPLAFPSAYSLSQGLPAGATSWSIGQNWSVNVSANGVVAPDNLTVTIVQSGRAIFQTVLFLSNSGYAPYFTASSVWPNPLGASKFYVNASVVCWSSCASTSPVTATISELEGNAQSIVTLTCTVISSSSTLTAESCTWLSAGNPAVLTGGATYYVFITATDSASRTQGVTVPVVGAGGGGGGGTSPPALDGSVTVINGNNPASIAPVVTTSKTNDLLVLALATDQQSTVQSASSVTDSFSLTWAEEGTPYKYSSATGPGTIGPAYLYLFYALTGAHAPGADTVTVSFSGHASHTVSAILLAFSGVSTSTPWDPAGTVTNSATTGTATAAPNSLTTSFQYDAVVSFLGVQTMVAPSGPAGWAGGTTEVSNPTDFTAYLNYDLVSATGNYVASESWATSHAWGLVVAAIEG